MFKDVSYRHSNRIFAVWVKFWIPDSKIAQHVKEIKHAIGFIHAVAITQAKNFEQRC